MENNWPEKFDIIIANPPYSKKLDLKFLDKAFDLAKEEVVFVHPATSFVDIKGKTKLYENINTKIGSYLKSITLFNGNPIFNIALFVPCSITHTSKKIKSEEFILDNRITGIKQKCNNLANVTIYGERKEFWSIFKKVKSDKNLHDLGTVLGPKQEHRRILNNPGCYFIEFTHIRGHSHVTENDKNFMAKDDFYTLVRKDIKISYKENPKYNIWFEFKTKKEANNFIIYCKTYFARFCLSIFKINQHLSSGEMRNIPYLDFTQEWTDEKLYKYFNITEEEQTFIKEVIPPYYD